MISQTFTGFFRRCTEAGLEAKDCGGDHWQIIGGHLLVNYYPFARRGATVYVAGTNEGIKPANDELAIESARRIPDGIEKSGRKVGGYKKYKRRMMRKTPSCYWCNCKLTQETSSVDHKIPLALGGINNPNNYVLACIPCNSKKGHHLWKQP